jgi:hypothetical protein
MSTISSKQEKRNGLVDPIYVLVFLVLILALLVLGPLTGNINNSFSGALGTLGNAPAGVSASGHVSFTSDQRYWDANCSHGWSSDATCENIVLRSQSCVVNVASAYCSEYDLYLLPFRNQ